MSILVNHWRMDSSLNALIHSSTGEVRRLGEYHFILLETLVKNADEVLSRSFLMSEVWKNRVVGGNSLPTAIHALRTAIDDNGKQQEIIKTIPKKGYLFNKHYISVVESDEKSIKPTTDNSVEHIADGDELQSSLLPEIAGIAESTVALQVIDNVVLNTSKKTQKHIFADKNHSHKMLFIILGIIIITLPLLTLFHHPFTKGMASDSPSVVKETILNADHISLYHLYEESTEKETNARFSSHIHDGLKEIEKLLNQHKSSIDVYYKVSFSKVAMNIIIKNQCNRSWQLALRFNNWQNKDSEMNTIMFQEVETMLNEMPACK